MYFNNCRKRNHVHLYGGEAFFDLETSGPQAKVADRLANELSVGETCIVATPDTKVTLRVTLHLIRIDSREKW